MPESIIDGRGGGQSAQVDDHGRLYVLANTVSHPAHHASYHQNFFYSYHTTAVPGTDTETPVALVEGISSSIELEIYSVLITLDQAALVSVYFDALYTSGGETVTPRNSNRTSNNTLDTAFYAGGAGADLVVDTTAQELVTEFDLAARQPFLYPIDGTVILGNDESLLFSVTASVATTARITIGLTSHTSGTKL